MAKKIKVKLDFKGFRKNVLQADWMLAAIENVAQGQCGADEHIKSFIGFDRAQAIIYPGKEVNNDRTSD